ncbi:hypothetical protein [Mycobacteroides abscessus]|uniref:hypothetical protein n=1 Tax=Mycobacteroides abscessus TaxID=36809 RepID=UPI0019D30BF4|nr:hypothetical protein [Mycobacteroides abscessus]
MDVPIAFPLDADGFLRRECPSCRDEFKWHYGPTATRPAAAIDPLQYTCPLCGVAAAHDHWFTQDQVQLQRQTVEFYAMDAVNDELKRAFGKNYTPGKNTAPAPTPLHEPNDMIIVEPPCHPWEPVKVPEQRADAGPLHCIVCGETFAV